MKLSWSQKFRFRFENGCIIKKIGVVAKGKGGLYLAVSDDDVDFLISIQTIYEYVSKSKYFIEKDMPNLTTFGVKI